VYASIVGVIPRSSRCLLWKFVTTPSYVITYGIILVLHSWRSPSSLASRSRFLCFSALPSMAGLGRVFLPRL
jgi:hypothetical protein